MAYRLLTVSKAKNTAKTMLEAIMKFLSSGLKLAAFLSLHCLSNVDKKMALMIEKARPTMATRNTNTLMIFGHNSGIKVNLLDSDGATAGVAAVATVVGLGEKNSSSIKFMIGLFVL